MRTVNARELRNAIPHLKQALAESGELLFISKGEAIAVLSPVKPAITRPRLPSLKAFRESMPMMKTPAEVLIREDRDRR